MYIHDSKVTFLKEVLCSNVVLQSSAVKQQRWQTCNGDHAISVHADHMVSGGTGSVLGIWVGGQRPDPTPG